MAMVFLLLVSIDVLFLSLVAFLMKTSNDVSNCVMIEFHSLSVTSPMQNI